MHACMYVCMYACMSVCMYVCMHVCLYACMSVCMYVHVSICVRDDRLQIRRLTARTQTWTPTVMGDIDGEVSATDTNINQA